MARGKVAGDSSFPSTVLRDHPVVDTHLDASLQGNASVLQYVVVREQDLWWIRYQGRNFAGTRVFAAALRDAVEAAREAGLQGFDASVFVEFASGYRRLVWSYGEEPCPLERPRGRTRRRSSGATSKGP
jgi:hypothetical protein